MTMTDRSVNIICRKTLQKDNEGDHKMPPKIIDKDQRKHEIASVALEIFAENGFETTSISRVAEAAGIGKGTIYEYFASKEELMFNAIMVWTKNMEEGTARVLEETHDPVKRLRKLIETLVHNFLSDPRTIKMALSMFQLLLSDASVFRQYDIIRESMRSLRKTFVDVLLDGVSQGVFRPEIARDAEKIVINLLAYLDGIALHYFMNKTYFDVNEQINFYLEHLLENLRAE
ncbi:TetR family transcriptional regulator [candidate division KSB3 bacterium]|uniref:TetR family transcriptional regulator n=1 Tax=candidate division KSB3 bacterium TaxID=2044937 RepID=A0A9D5JUR2_9BACT|nr:TetR family transcriptional regulator [candidate division KSB3 bacterium]MBD3324617.1 TetR family transcriptional regulator [candidate division KSB3 bacterium]